MTTSTAGLSPASPVPREQVDILLIEDDAAIRAMLISTLKKRGYSLRWAPEGQSAMRLLSNLRVRLLITDIYMPGMDGIEVIMKYSALSPGTPILAISGGGEVGGPGCMLRPAKLLGCQRTLAKPFEIEHFLALVEELIGKP